jgi:glycerate kinase
LNALEEAFGTLDALRSVQFTIATDVTNPLLGPSGAAHVFAPQKGATPQMVAELETRAQRFAQESAHLLGRDLSQEPGAGAAGGLGYALMQYLDAKRVSGVDFILDKALPHTTLHNVSFIITGEGHADRQTLMGKLPIGVLHRAKAHNIPVVLIAGQASDREALLSAGFAQVLSVTPTGMPLSEALRPEVARRNITTCITEANLPG